MLWPRLIEKDIWKKILLMILNSLKGMLVLTPRNMVQASGMYNTLMSCTDPALIIEPLNAYRLKEKEPLNLGEFTVPLGKIEIINPGTDITVVSYGSTLKLVEKTIPELERNNIIIKEIPITFYDRKKGISKIPRIEILRTLKNLFFLTFKKIFFK